MSVALTPEQVATARLLVEEHNELNAELLELNRSLDDHLSRRGQGLSRVQPLARPGNSQCDKLAAKNEQQRKVNDELARNLLVIDALAKTDDLKQRLAVLTSQAELLRDENKSFENIYANQLLQTSLADKIENEMKKAKQDHHEEIVKLKDAIRQLKELRESDSEQVRGLQRAETKLELRLKLQADAVASTTSTSELEFALKKKEEELCMLKEKILSFSKLSTGKAKARNLNDKKSREFDELRSEADLLREKLEALKIHEEL